jgi:hypothetical protein
MNSPTLELRKGAYVALQAAMTTAGYTARVRTAPQHGTTLPYVEMVAPGVTVLPRHNKTHEGADSTHLFIAWSTTVDDAEALANVVLSALTDRTSPISVDASVNLCDYDLESMGPLIEDDLAGDGTAYGVPVRLRYRTHE